MYSRTCAAQVWQHTIGAEMAIHFQPLGCLSERFRSAELQSIWGSADYLSLEDKRDESYLLISDIGEGCCDRQLERCPKSCAVAGASKTYVHEGRAKEFCQEGKSGGGS